MQAAARDRIEPRTRAMVRAKLRDSMGSREVCVIDISTRGLLGTAARPPRRGDFIELTIGLNHLTGQVVWASDRRFGVSLRERVSVAAVAEGGKSKVELQRSAGSKRRRTGMLTALWSNPQALGRLGQFVTFAVLAAAAGWLIVELSSASLAPMEEAIAHLN